MRTINKFLSFLLFTSQAFAGSLRTDETQQALNQSSVRNYIKNSGAEFNLAGITDADSIVTRNTTAVLEGDFDFLINADGVGEKAIFQADDLQVGLLGGSCEVTFTYRGDASLYKAYATLAGVTVSQELQLTNTNNYTTGSQPASLLFPCGTSGTADPAFVIEATSASAAAIQVDSVYLGKALNIGSVAQAEAIVHASRITSGQAISTTTVTTVVYNNEALDVYGEYNPSTGEFIAKRAKRYVFSGGGRFHGTTTGEASSIFLYKNGSLVTGCAGSSTAPGISDTVTFPDCPVTGAVGDIFTFRASAGADSDYEIFNSSSSFIAVKAFPLTSEIVVRGDVTSVEVDAGGTPTGPLNGTGPTIWGTVTRNVGGAYNSSNGTFTAPLSGNYCWNAGIFLQGSSPAVNQFLSFIPYVDASAIRYEAFSRSSNAGVSDTTAQSNGCRFLNAGQVLSFRANTNYTSASFGSGGLNYLSIRNDSGAVPKPFIPGSVFSASTGVTKIINADFVCSGSSAITFQDGTAIASIGNISSSTCAFTFSGTPFSSANYSCAITQNSTNTTSFAVAKLSAKTTSGFTATFVGQSSGTTGTVGSFDGNLVCMGPN